MNYRQFYTNIPSWKQPYHVLKAHLARDWIKLFSQAEVVAITGSVGKTTAKEATISVLGQKFVTIGSVDNLDPIFNIPNTLLKIRPNTQKVVLEFGVEYQNEMDFYLDLVKPQIGCITKIYWTHTQFLKNLDGIISEKGKLLQSLPNEGYAILNYDDPNIKLKMGPKTRAKIFWFGENPKSDLVISDFKKQKSGSSFKLSYKNSHIDINWQLIGRQQTVAAAIAASVGILSGLSLEKIKPGLERLSPQAHRMNLVKAKNRLILDDTYNSSPIAVSEAVKTLASFTNLPKVIVLSDMKELGSYSKTGHQEIAKDIVDSNADLVFLIGKEVIHTYRELIRLNFPKERIKHSPLSKAFQQVKKLNYKPIILVKGSRHTHMERFVQGLLGKSTIVDCSICGRLSLRN